jgi:hypothetical protein
MLRETTRDGVGRYLDCFLRTPISSIYKSNGTAMPISGMYKINGPAKSCKCVNTRHIFVRTLKGKTLTSRTLYDYHFQEESTLHLVLRQGRGIHIFVETLTGKTLTGRTLYDYNFQRESTLHLVLRRGGGIHMFVRTLTGKIPPAAPDPRRQPARAWPHAVQLQLPEGDDAPPGATPGRRHTDLCENARGQDRTSSARPSPAASCARPHAVRLQLPAEVDAPPRATPARRHTNLRPKARRSSA